MVDLVNLRKVLSDNERKVAAVNELQASLQQASQVEDADELTELLKLALHSTSAHVSAAAIGCITLFFPLLVPTAAHPAPSSSDAASTSASASADPALVLKHAFVALLPLQQLVDSKERVREAARDALVAAGRTALRLGVNASAGTQGGGKEKEGPWTYLSRVMHESAFSSKSPRAREQAIHYILALRNPALTTPLAPLRPFTPLLLPLLSDADPAVRALALSSVSSIFSSPSVTPAARADLKKELIKHDVSKKVQDTILATVIGGATLERSSSAGSLLSDRGSTSAAGHGGSSQRGSSEAGSERSAPPRRSPVASATATLSGSPSATPRPRTTATVVPSLLASLPSTAFPSDPTSVHEPTTDVEALYIASEADLRGEFEAMKEGFTGKETEFNWMVRDRSVARIRGMLKGKAHENYLEGFLSGIKSTQDGILKTASSLRTTVATNALALVTELSNALGHTFDPLLEGFLSHCLGMAGQTKKLVATASQAACKALITNSAYHLETVQLLWLGMNDKIVLARTFISAHVRTFVEVHGRVSRGPIEQTGGLDVLEQCIKRGLSDANALVKENSRATYWLANDIWPKMTERVAASLDATTKKQLDKADPRNAAATKAPAAKVARPSVRSMIAQAKASSKPSSPTASSPAAATPAASSSTPTTTPTRTPIRTSVLVAPSALIPSEPETEPTSPDSLPTPIHADPSLVPGEPTDLMGVTSPFLGDDQDSSLDFAHVSSLPSSSSPSISTPISLPRARNASLVLPVTEPIVDAALRSQADQAEQAAQRLLELAESDAEDDHGDHGRVIGPGGHLVERTAPERTATPLQNFHRTPVTMRKHDVFEDSPDVRDQGYGANGAGKGNWWMKKVDALPTAEPLPPDTAERTSEIAALVSSLQAGQITADGLRQLSSLSKERPLRDDEESASILADVQAKPEFGASSFWDGSARTFSRVFDGLAKFLNREDALDRRDSALVLLKDLVENQFPAFAGDELEVFELLFKLREDTSRTTIAAVEAIADVFCSRLEPLYGLGSLRSSLATYLAQPSGARDAKSYALGLRLIGKLFERIPSEILEDELPKSKGLIKTGLNDAHSGDLRRAAVTALVSAQMVLQDEERLGLLVDGLAPDQRNLLAYYIEKSRKK
ncbi:hypothetical protein RQP46_000321 [Phenoliferia psychrophenolica]